MVWRVARRRRLYGESYSSILRRRGNQEARIQRWRRNAPAYRRWLRQAMARRVLQRLVRRLYARRIDRSLLGPRARGVRNYVR